MVSTLCWTVQIVCALWDIQVPKLIKKHIPSNLKASLLINPHNLVKRGLNLPHLIVVHVNWSDDIDLINSNYKAKKKEEKLCLTSFWSQRSLNMMDSPVEAVKMLTSARISPILSSNPEREEDEEPIAMTEDLFVWWVENERRPLVLDEKEGRQWEEEEDEVKQGR